MKPWICWVVWLFAFSTGPCLAAPEFPPFTGQRVTVLSSIREDFTPLEAVIREIERKRIETYFVVVRDAPSESSEELLKYIKTLSGKWNVASLDGNGGLEWRYSLLIVLNTSDRRIYVEPGPQIQNYLQTNILQENKAPELARAVAPLALTQPVGAGGTAAALIRKVKSVAAAILQFEDRNPGYQSGDFAQQLTDEKRYAEIVINRLEMERRGRRTVEKLLSEARTLPVQFEALESLRLRDPFAAKRKLGSLVNRRGNIEGTLSNLAMVGPETKAMIEVAKSRQIACRMALRRIPEPEEPDLREQMKANEQRLKDAEAVADNDYDEAQALTKEAAKHAESLLVSIIERAFERKQSARSRQVAMIALPMVSSVAIPLGIVSYLWKRRNQDSRRRARVFAGVSSSNLALHQFRDRLNGLALRQQRLTGNPNSEPPPWRGNSKELFVAAVTHRDAAQQRWEQLSAEATEMQTRLRQKGVLEREVEDRLSALEETAEIEAALAGAKSAFARLEDAVRGSAEASRAAEAGLAHADRQLRTAAQSDFSLQFCRKTRSQSEERLQAIRTLAAADPLQAADQAHALAAQVSQLNERLNRVLTEGARHGRLLRGVEALENSATNLRDGGLRLREPGVDPDPLLAYVRDEAANAWRRLDVGETVEAAAHLDLAERLARRADQSMATQVHARDYCTEELPRQREKAARLRRYLKALSDASQCATIQAELVQVEAQLAEATTLATTEIQKYRSARERLETAGQSLRKLGEQLPQPAPNT